MKHPTLRNEADLQEAIRLVGEIRRDYEITKAECDDQIARTQAAYAPMLNEFLNNEQEIISQITKYCNANYDTLFKGKGKTLKLITGEISRRVKPNSIVVNDLDLALAKIKELGFTDFIRVKEDLNKNALLDNPDFIELIEGLELQKGIENLIIKPYATKV